MPLKKSVSWNRASCRRWWSRCRPARCLRTHKGYGRAPATAWRGPFRMTRSARLASDPRGISKRSTGSRPNALSAPPNARPASGKTERLVAGGASPPSSRRRRRHPRHHPALARPSLPPSFVSGPKKKPRDGGDARSSTSSVAGAALPASAKVRRRDASRSARTHAAVSSAVGRFGRQVTSFASASAAAGVPNAPAPRASASARLRRRAVAASAASVSRRWSATSTSGTSASGTRARPSRKTTPGSRRATSPVARSNATHLCVPREAHGRTGERRAEAAPSPYVSGASSSSSDGDGPGTSLSPSLSRAAKSAASCCTSHRAVAGDAQNARRVAATERRSARASSAGALDAS